MWYLTVATFHSVETATFLGLIKRLPCERIQDGLGFWILCHGFRFSGTWFRICCHLNLYSGFQCPGFQIVQVQICSDSGFHKQNFHGFRIPLQGAKRERLSKPVLYSEPLDISRTGTPTGEFEIIKIRIGTSSGKNNYWSGAQFSLHLWDLL